MPKVSSDQTPARRLLRFGSKFLPLFLSSPRPVRVYCCLVYLQPFSICHEHKTNASPPSWCSIFAVSKLLFLPQVHSSTQTLPQTTFARLMQLSFFFFTGFSFSLCIYIDVHRLNLVLLPAVPSWFGCLLMGPAWSPAGTYTQETDTMRIWESHGGQAVTGGEDDKGPQHFPQKQQIIWIFPRWSLPLYF